MPSLALPPYAPDRDETGTWHSQVGQDYSIARLFQNRRSGTFVDLAASHPIKLSNSRALERDWGWRGLCIEAQPELAAALRRRRSCAVHEGVVASEAGHVQLEYWKPRPDAGFARVVDGETVANVTGRMTVAAMPLAQILLKHAMPPIIDYLSLDVEGQEFNALRLFPFDRWQIRAMSIERPPEKLKKLLRQNGFRLVLRYGSHFSFGEELWLNSTWERTVAASNASSRVLESVRDWNALVAQRAWTKCRSGMPFGYACCGIHGAYLQAGKLPAPRAGERCCDCTIRYDV